MGRLRRERDKVIDRERERDRDGQGWTGVVERNKLRVRYVCVCVG